MKYVKLGGTGLKVSRLCLGCMSYGSSDWSPWVLDEDKVEPFFTEAHEAGINFFDTADMYSNGRSEEIVGNQLRRIGGTSWRDRFVIATKVFNPMDPNDPNARGLSRKHIMAAVDGSLKRLGTDYIDLYQLHRYDYETPVEETLSALHDLVTAGKVRYLGASSMYAWQLARMQGIARLNGWTRFSSMQPQYNLIYREEEREVLPFCEADGIGVIPWSPLARGFLASNRKRGDGEATARSRGDAVAKSLYQAEADYAVKDALEAVAAERGIPPMQIALAWVLSKSAITAPIIGATKPGHIASALAALEVALSPEEIERLEAPYQPKAISDHQ